MGSDTRDESDDLLEQLSELDEEIENTKSKLRRLSNG